MPLSKTICLGALTLTVTDDEIHASLSPAKRRRVFALAPMALCRINEETSSPCLWVGSVAFDLTRAEINRLKKEFPQLRVTGGATLARPITDVMSELPALARRQAE